jgi:hypothetical protein
MAKILVVGYSRSGTTETVAREVAKALGADFDRIEDTASRAGVLGFIGGVWEAVARGVPAIRTRRDPADYDLVVLASPTWAGTMASPMRAYLLMHRAALHRVATIITMAGHGGEQAQRDMLALCGVDAAPGCICTEADVKGNRFQTRVMELVARIKRMSEESSLTSAVA